jgi:hypothetical protein
MQNADTPGWALGTGKFHLSQEKHLRKKSTLWHAVCTLKSKRYENDCANRSSLHPPKEKEIDPFRNHFG